MQIDSTGALDCTALDFVSKGIVEDQSQYSCRSSISNATSVASPPTASSHSMLGNPHSMNVGAIVGGVIGGIAVSTVVGVSFGMEVAKASHEDVTSEPEYGNFFWPWALVVRDGAAASTTCNHLLSALYWNENVMRNECFYF
jgi:hypothetical protein